MNSNGRGQLILAVAVGTIVALMGQLPMQHKLQNLEHEVSQLRQQVAQQSVAAHEIPVRMAGLLDHTTDGPLPGGLASSDAAAAHEQMLTQLVLVTKHRPSQAREDIEVVRIAHTPQNDPQPAAAPLRVAKATPASYEDGARVMSESELDAIFAGAGVVGPGSAVSAAAAAAPASGDTEGAATRLIPRVDRGGVLLPKGRLQVEPTISYSHLSSNRVGLSGFSVFDVIFIGEIRSDEINRDIVTSSVNTRYGVTNNLEVELDVPTQFQYEEVLSGPIENREQSIESRGGLNDISAAMFYQFVREHGAMPSLIANMKLRAPTGQAPKLGSGTWGVKGGLTMVKTSDPVALFSNVGYSLNLPGTVNGVSIDPGDSFEYSAGLAYALNYHLAVNGGFEQIFISQSKAGGGLIKGSRLVISNLKAGINYALTKKLSLDFSVGAGLTEDSPDVTVTFSLPYTF